MIKIRIITADNDSTANERVKQILAEEGVNELFEVDSDQPDAVVEIASTLGNDSIRLVDNTRVALLCGTQADDYALELRKMNELMRRNFLVNRPRMAIIGDTTAPLVQAVRTLADEKRWVYGPYNANEAPALANTFDVLLYTQPASAPLTNGIKIVTSENPLRVVVTDADDLLTAAYAATDITRMRRRYDSAHANPLPKLYKDRPDAGERLRFNIPTKK